MDKSTDIFSETNKAIENLNKCINKLLREAICFGTYRIIDSRDNELLRIIHEDYMCYLDSITYFHYSVSGDLEFYTSSKESIISFNSMSIEHRLEFVQAIISKGEMYCEKINSNELFDSNALFKKLDSFFTEISSYKFDKNNTIYKTNHVECITKCYDDNGNYYFKLTMPDEFNDLYRKNGESSTSYNFCTNEQNFDDYTIIIKIIGYLKSINFENAKYGWEYYYEDLIYDKKIAMFKNIVECYDDMREKIKSIIDDNTDYCIPYNSVGINIKYYQNQICCITSYGKHICRIVYYVE